MKGIRSGDFDLILCRNVLIYLQREAQENVLATCLKLLKTDGYLVLGSKEVIPQNLREYVVPVDKNARIYKNSFTGER